MTGLPFRVIQELELAQIKQRLDAAIIRGEATQTQVEWRNLPDGLTDLADHNIVTYKSIRESLGPPAMWELVSNAVLYAKQEWKKKSSKAIKSIHTMRLIAVATHRPAWLDGATVQSTALSGIYEVEFLGLTIRETERMPRNSLWRLLSGDGDLVSFGIKHYQMHDAALYNILNELKRNYAMEGIEMPYTIEDYKREAARELLGRMSPKEVLEIVPGRELLQSMSAEERLEGMSREEIEAYLEQLTSNNRRQ